MSIKGKRRLTAFVFSIISIIIFVLITNKANVDPSVVNNAVDDILWLFSMYVANDITIKTVGNLTKTFNKSENK